MSDGNVATSGAAGNGKIARRSTSVARSIREQCDHCRHFTGLGNGPDRQRVAGKERGRCAALIPYDDVRKQGSRMVALPCFHPEPDNMPQDGVWPTCPKLSFKTPAELDAEAAASEERTKRFLQRITVVRPAILKHAGVTEKSATEDDGDDVPRDRGESDKAGAFPCPICTTGTLSYRVSGYNGHVWANCSTTDCCSWME